MDNQETYENSANTAAQAELRQPPNGVLVIDKPVGPTSHDLVAQARRYFRTKRVGHAGTLDPMASGVLLLLLGEGTKLSQALTLEKKSYQAVVTFGTSTDSDDATGKVLASVELAPGELTLDRLNAAIASERAISTQLPPVVSAIKHDGQAAYARHRKGQTVSLVPRDVRVFELTILEHSPLAVTLALTVSKGYYVRALARDLGQRLGVPAHLSSLRRTESGDFSLNEAVSWPPSARPNLLSLEDTVRRILPCLTLTEEGTDRARVGKTLSANHVSLSGSAGEPLELHPLVPTAWLSSCGRLIALGQFDEDGQGSVLRGFSCNQPSDRPPA